jgi:hypothetical protein
MVAARGDSLGFEDQRDFSESDALRGDRASAAAARVR